MHGRKEDLTNSKYKSTTLLAYTYVFKNEMGGACNADGGEEECI
jgi:hypothetical protein